MRSDRISLSGFQKHFLFEGLSFVTWKLPGNNLPVTIFPGDGQPHILSSIGDVSPGSGFIMAPFDDSESKIVVFRTDNLLKGWEFQCPELIKAGHFIPVSVTIPFIINQAEYQAKVDEVRQLISEGHAEKVVLSRISKVAGIRKELLPELFAELIQRYPQAFVYLIHSEPTGTWIGASPETLVRVETDRFTTMALAGTREYNGLDLPVDWSEKEIREQAHVLRYIQTKLAAAGYAFQESNIQTIRAGNVVHLRSMFSGALKKGSADWRELANMLFPTPAVCGTEEHAAMKLIREIEPHNREYYSGFLGPFSDTGNTDVFVNLRCMKVVDDVAYLYAGGGILGESDPLREWEETELKFKTLTEAIKTVNQASL